MEISYQCFICTKCKFTRLLFIILTTFILYLITINLINNTLLRIYEQEMQTIFGQTVYFECLSQLNYLIKLNLFPRTHLAFLVQLPGLQTLQYKRQETSRCCLRSLVIGNIMFILTQYSYTRHILTQLKNNGNYIKLAIKTVYINLYEALKQDSFCQLLYYSHISI